jgi:DNA-directed RNA polymerase specialized sigma24 family protein
MPSWRGSSSTRSSISRKIHRYPCKSVAEDLTPVRQKWALTQDAFDKLLSTLSSDRETAGARYLEIRNNLTRFFEWRGCSFPEDHADETINRVAKRVADGEEILNTAGYAIGVARLLLLEINKGRQREHAALAELGTASEAYTQDDDGEPRLVCLRNCLQTLSSDNRALILQYYQGEKSEKIQNRKKLLERLGIPVNTLRMRALRLRERLQSCVEECLGHA